MLVYGSLLRPPVGVEEDAPDAAEERHPQDPLTGVL